MREREKKKKSTSKAWTPRALYMSLSVSCALYSSYVVLVGVAALCRRRCIALRLNPRAVSASHAVYVDLKVARFLLPWIPAIHIPHNDFSYISCLLYLFCHIQLEYRISPRFDGIFRYNIQKKVFIHYLFSIKYSINEAYMRQMK